MRKKDRKIAKEIFQDYMDTRQDWRAETETQFKGKKKKIIASITRFLESTLKPKQLKRFRKAMDITGAGDHPAVVDFLYQLSKRKTKC